MNPLRKKLGVSNLNGLWLLVLFAFGQAHTILHHSLVAHHQCAVDGELAHGDHEHHHDGHAAEVADGGGASGAAHAGPALAQLPHDDESGAHDEHCRTPRSREERKLPPLCLAVRCRGEAELEHSAIADSLGSSLPVDPDLSAGTEAVTAPVRLSSSPTRATSALHPERPSAPRARPYSAPYGEPRPR